MAIQSDVELASYSLLDESFLEYTKATLRARSGSLILQNPLDPFYYLVKDLQNVVCYDPPSVLSPDCDVRHEINLVPGTKYCVTRQWPLPKKQCEDIDDIFRAKQVASMVRESKSTHSTPTFLCQKAPWKVAHCSCLQQA